MKAFFLFVMSLFLFCGCSSKNDNSQKHEIGKYVYVDAVRCIHVDKSCVIKTTTITKDYHSVDLNGILFVDTTEFGMSGDYIYCPKCVDDALYSKLQFIKERNCSATKINKIEAKKLYNALMNNGYLIDDLGDEKTFLLKMEIKSNRKQLFDWVKSRNDFRIGEYSDYEDRLLTIKELLK